MMFPSAMYESGLFDAKRPLEAWFSPGRINLIGEHLDYNGGHVLPAALTIGINGYIQYRDDAAVVMASADFPERVSLDLTEDIIYQEERGWGNYPAGIIAALRTRGTLPERGFNLFFSSSLPAGAGLSSSASIELLTAFMLTKSSAPSHNERTALTELARRVENDFIGVQCGIMDQFAIALGRAGRAILLNTADLSFFYVPVELNDYRFVIMNSNKPRKLSESPYNTRRHECEQAFVEIQKKQDIAALAEADESDLEFIGDPVLRRRAAHVITEEERVLNAVSALEESALQRFGALMNSSHQSLRDNFEVTGAELDALVSAAQSAPGCAGARMTGAGFGGCALALVQADSLPVFTETVGREYAEATSLRADFIDVGLGDGTGKTGESGGE